MSNRRSETIIVFCWSRIIYLRFKTKSVDDSAWKTSVSIIISIQQPDTRDSKVSV